VTTTGSAALRQSHAVTATGTTTVTASAVWDVPPQVPLNLTATTFNETRIDVDWDETVFGATGYDIERDGTIIVFDHPTSDYSDTGLAPATTFTYRARAVIG